jgi:hypothetical protein
MKKILFLVISIMIITVVWAKAENPIPSYNVPLKNQATFQEDNSGLGSVNHDLSKEKRDMNVSNAPGGKMDLIGLGTPAITVYIYRLDRSIVFGPYAIPEGKTISIPIDEGLWGVFAETTDPTYISVWTNDNP